MSIVLRSIQTDAIARVSEAFSGGAEAIILQAVTGYGKTVVASEIAMRASSPERTRRNRVLFLAHQDILIRQMSRKLREFGVPHGVIMAGRTPDHHQFVQVASVQTMMRRIKKFRYEFELIIIDEAHRSIAQGYRDVLEAIPDARVLGITGTPCRLDGRGLGVSAGGIYDTLITTETPKQMMEMGYLVEPVYYASKEKLDLSHVKKRAGESGYDDESLANVVDTPKITGSAVEHYKELAMGLPALTWCINIKHAEHTAAEFTSAGIPSVVLSGKSDAVERDRVLGALSRREILNVCFAQLLVEGVDVPALGALIMLRPSKSLNAYLQVCGRGLRVDPDNPAKKNCIILDHAGLAFGQGHGLCSEDREWSLDGAPKKKKKKKDHDPLSILQCEGCYLIFEPHQLVDNAKCPGCGKLMKRVRKGPEYVEGKLERITEQDAARAREARQQQVKKAKTHDELKAIGKDRGYDPEWANIQWGFKKRAKERADQRAQARANDLWGMTNGE